MVSDAALEHERDIRRRVHARFKQAARELAQARHQLARMTADRDYWREVATRRSEIVEIAERLIAGEPVTEPEPGPLLGQPSPADGAAAAELGELASQQRASAWGLRMAVSRARCAGTSWRSIAAILGVGHTNLHRQYHAGSPIVVVQPWQSPKGDAPEPPSPPC